MTYCEEFKIAGKSILAPDDSVSLKKTDLQASDSGRDENGVMHRFLLRRRVKTWAFQYSHLSGDALAYLESLFDGADTFLFTYTNPDGTTGTCTAYCQEINLGIKNIRTGLYSGVSFSVVEC